MEISELFLLQLLLALLICDASIFVRRFLRSWSNIFVVMYIYIFGVQTNDIHSTLDKHRSNSYSAH